LWCCKDEDAEYKKEVGDSFSPFFSLVVTWFLSLGLVFTWSLFLQLVRQNKDPEKDFPDPDSAAYITVPSTFYGRSFCVGYLGNVFPFVFSSFLWDIISFCRVLRFICYLSLG
jgi:hypothetical protein